MNPYNYPSQQGQVLNDQRINFLQDHIQKLPSILNPFHGTSHQSTIMANYTDLSGSGPQISYSGSNQSNKRIVLDSDNDYKKRMKYSNEGDENILNSSGSSVSSQTSPRSLSVPTQQMMSSSPNSSTSPMVMTPTITSTYLSGGTNTTPPLPSATITGGQPRKRKNEIVCTICEKPGNLLMCDAQCLRSFHVECLGLKDIQPNEKTDQQWECDDCMNEVNYCFSCKQRGAVGVDLMKCKVHQCGKFYHFKCVSEFSLAKLINTKTPRFNCPLHYCSVCGVSGDGKQSVHCVRCPTAFHVICMPPAVKMLTKSKETRKTGLVICPKHLNEQKHSSSNSSSSIPHPSSHLLYDSNDKNSISPQKSSSKHQHHSGASHQHQHQHHQHSHNSISNISNINININNPQIDVNNPLYNLIYSTSPISTPNINTPPFLGSPTSSPTFESPRSYDNSNNSHNKPKPYTKPNKFNNSSNNNNNNNNSNSSRSEPKNNSIDRLIEITKISNDSNVDNTTPTNNFTGNDGETDYSLITSLVSIKESFKPSNNNNNNHNHHNSNNNNNNNNNNNSNHFSKPILPSFKSLNNQNNIIHSPSGQEKDSILTSSNQSSTCDENRLIKSFLGFGTSVGLPVFKQQPQQQPQHFHNLHFQP